MAEIDNSKIDLMSDKFLYFGPSSKVKLTYFYPYVHKHDGVEMSGIGGYCSEKEKSFDEWELCKENYRLKASDFISNFLSRGSLENV